MTEPMATGRHATWQAKPSHREPVLWSILVLYVLVGSLYVIGTPVFEAPDEGYHFPYIQHLATGGHLPVLDPAAVGPWHQEGGQPPLYYWLMARAIRILRVETDDMARVLWVNPHADIGRLTNDGNTNWAIHQRDERTTWHGTVLAVRVVRWLSLLLGAVTVATTYRVAGQFAEGVHDQSALPALAALLTALNPMFLFIHAAVNNDALVTALCTVTLWQVVRWIDRSPTPRQWLILGVLIGLAALTKVSALALLLPVGMLAIVTSARQRSWRALTIAMICVALPIASISGWWFLRNWRLYRDPLGLIPFLEVVGRRYPVPSLRQLAGEYKVFLMSFWGFFGWLNVPAPNWVYAILLGFGGIGLLGVPLAVWRAYRASHIATARWDWRLALLVLWPVTMAISLIRWTLMTPASQGRLIYPAISAISTLMAMGLLAWWPPCWQRARQTMVVLVGTVLLGSATIMPLAVIAPTYVPEITSATEAEATIAQRLDVTLGEGARLLGYDIGDSKVEPGGQVELVLYWDCTAPLDGDNGLFVHLLGMHDLIMGQRDRYPGQGLLPTSLWVPGEVIVDRVVIPLSQSTMAPQELTIGVGLYDFGNGMRLPIRDAKGDPLGDMIRFGHIQVPMRVVDGIPNPVYYDLDHQVALIGYELEEFAVRPGETFELTLYWRALRDLETNYSVFTQVLGDQNRIWAQMDGWPQGGNAPTTTWRKGQVIRDPYTLDVAADAPPGVYALDVGMYAKGQRLHLLGKDGYVQDTRIRLGVVRILATPGS